MNQLKSLTNSHSRFGFALCFFLSFALLVSISHGERPNVLFIAIDDLRPELGAYGSRAVTPNLDRLAAEGLRFDRAYCAQAVCGASRLSLMTSLYPEYTEERTHHVSDWRQRHPKVVTLNQLFKSNGYLTMGVGKIYHSWDGPGVDHSNWNSWVGTQGFKYVNPETMAEAKVQAEALGNGSSRGPTTEVGIVDNAEELYMDGWRAREGVRLLERAIASEQPFFLAVGFSLPHLPFAAPKKYWDLYERDSFALPDNLGIPPGYPEWAANLQPGEMSKYADVPHGGDPKSFSDEMNRRLIHGYHASVSYTDRNVGLLLEALRNSGVRERTIVVLWSDHGWKLGDHHSWCKHTNFECDTRVPLVVMHPGMQSAVGQTDAIVELVDLYPTLAELCDLGTPDGIHGRSFESVLQDPSTAHREFAYSSYPRRPNDDIVGHSIRDVRYRYTEWWDAETGEVLARVATDLVDDPGETTNALLGNEEAFDRYARELARIVHAARELP